MSIGLNVLGVVGVGIVAYIVVGYPVSIYNGFVSLKNNIDKSSANLDVLLKQRSDEIPNLVETVKGYMKHEASLLVKIAQIRTQLMQATTISQKSQASLDMSSQLKTLFSVAEGYPKLQANDSFLKLQQRISQLENEIADRREFYNDSVTTYNTQLQSFPDLLIAKMFSFKEHELFAINELEKSVPAVNVE